MATYSVDRIESAALNTVGTYDTTGTIFSWANTFVHGGPLYIGGTATGQLYVGGGVGVGTPGYSGTFSAGGAHVVTVLNGIITGTT
jgi:hypothetical protein